MRRTFDTVWQRRGTSWLWDATALEQVCSVAEVWSLRRFLRAVGRWPESLPSNGGRTLVVAGLGDSLDLLAPGEAERWLDATIKSAILSFQDDWGADGALVFWVPRGETRLVVNLSTDSVGWLCEAPHRDVTLDLGRLLWGEANDYPQHICPDGCTAPAGLFHLRIT